MVSKAFTRALDTAKNKFKMIGGGNRHFQLNLTLILNLTTDF